jgi:hypothetical protein
VSKDNIIKLIQPGNVDDQLTEILRNGARALLAQAVEAEVADFLDKHADYEAPLSHPMGWGPDHSECDVLYELPRCGLCGLRQEYNEGRAFSVCARGGTVGGQTGKKPTVPPSRPVGGAGLSVNSPGVKIECH